MSNTARMLTLLALLALAGVFLGSRWMRGDPKLAPDTNELPVSRVAAITPAAANAAGIEVALAGSADIRETVTLYGTVKPNAEREQNVRARYPGVVKSVTKRPGDLVKRGDVLLVVESSDSLRNYDIASRFDGRVLERSVNPGETVSSDAVLIRVADLSTVWVEFAVFARDFGRVRAGQAMRLVGSDDRNAADMQVAYVAPAGDTDSQSVVARADVANADGHWVPGQFVTGEVVVAETRVPVAVTPAALQQLDGKPVVFLKVANGFEVREVEVGRRSATAIEVVKGLNGGETYVAANSYIIKADLIKGQAEAD